MTTLTTVIDAYRRRLPGLVRDYPGADRVQITPTGVRFLYAGTLFGADVTGADDADFGAIVTVTTVLLDAQGAHLGGLPAGSTSQVLLPSPRRGTSGTMIHQSVSAVMGAAAEFTGVSLR